MILIGEAYQWRINWKITLLVILLLPLLLRLGFWQLSRADEKRALAQTFVERQQLPPATLAELLGLPDDNIAYRRVRLSGQFVAGPVFLLDNQIQFGSVGYNALQVFVASDQNLEQRFVVNRGWVAGSPDRRLPPIATPEQSVTITASVYIPVGSPVLLTEDRWSDDPIRVIQSVEIDKIAQLSGADIYPYQLRIEAGELGALDVDWQIVSTAPEKHMGYAVQWFAMSVALLVLWLYASLQRLAPENQ